MEKIVYSKEQIKNLEILGKGDRSVVYKDPNKNKALKIYKRGNLCYLEPALIYTNNEKLRQCNVIVPEGIVHINSKNCGFYSEIVNGYTIWQLMKGKSFNIKVSDFQRAYDESIQKVIELSEMGYNLFDLYEQNIMYDTKKNKIMFIDIDAWCKGRKSKRLTNRNLYELNASIDIPKIKKHLIQK
jgi:hypothetical protein